MAGTTTRLALPYPTLTENYHYEFELVVAIGKGGKNIPVERANEHIFGYGVGLDMTRRDLQIKMREQGRPWEIGKAFDYAGPIGVIHPASQTGHFTKGAISLTVDGVVGPSSRIGNLVFATGHGPLGITLAPATGEAITDAILGGPQTIDEAILPDRFGI